MTETAARAPHSIQVHPADNVAIVANDGGLPAGSMLPDGTVLVEKVPQGHKVSLVDMAEGDAVLRYVVIGYALAALPPAAGCTSGACGCRPRASSTACRSPPSRRRRWRRSTATPSRATATRTARSARATSWPSPRRCSAWPASPTSRWRASRPNCCPSTPTSTTWWAWTTATAAASPSTRRTR